MTTTLLRGAAAVDLRRAFRHDASSVWVVTSAHAGSPVGFTAVSVASVSLAPPLLSFNVSQTSSSLATLLASRRYAVHLLAGDQEHVARRFAADATARFADRSTWSWADDGLPRLHGSLLRAAGDLVDMVRAGDSLLAVGGVESTTELTDDCDDPRLETPLLHHARSYVTPAAAAS